MDVLPEIPDTVIRLDTVSVFKGALTIGVKLNALGAGQPAESTELPAGVPGHWSLESPIAVMFVAAKKVSDRWQWCQLH